MVGNTGSIIDMSLGFHPSCPSLVVEASSNLQIGACRGVGGSHRKWGSRRTRKGNLSHCCNILHGEWIIIRRQPEPVPFQHSSHLPWS